MTTKLDAHIEATKLAKRLAKLDEQEDAAKHAAIDRFAGKRKDLLNTATPEVRALVEAIRS